jgi:hypothetical protein
MSFSVPFFGRRIGPSGAVITDSPASATGGSETFKMLPLI